MQALLLTRELPSFGYRCVLAAGRCTPEEGDRPCPLRPDDVVEWEADLSRAVHPWRNVKALWQLWRLFREERPDIVHTHTAMAGSLGRLAAWLAGVPIVVHTFHGNCLKAYFSPLQTRIFRMIETGLARGSDAICAISPQQIRELSDELCICPSEKLRLIPLGLDLDDYFALRPPPNASVFTVGWFGRMVPVKNVGLLAATIQHTLGLSPTMRFLIAGDGPDRGVLDDVRKLFDGRIEFLGWQEEILPAVARCDALLLTSRDEGTPVALIQGMAAARPFVSTAAGGVVDLADGRPFSSRQAAATGGEKPGFITPATASAIGGALLKLENDRELGARMGRAGRAFAAEFGKEHLLSNLDGLYRDLLSKKAKTGRNK